MPRRAQSPRKDKYAPTLTRTTDWTAAAETIAARIALAAPLHDAADSFVADAYDLLKAERGVSFESVVVSIESGGLLECDVPVVVAVDQHDG